jgi:rRNA processing protein Gar1
MILHTVIVCDPYSVHPLSDSIICTKRDDIVDFDESKHENFIPPNFMYPISQIIESDATCGSEFLFLAVKSFDLIERNKTIYTVKTLLQDIDNLYKNLDKLPATLKLADMSFPFISGIIKLRNQETEQGVEHGVDFVIVTRIVVQNINKIIDPDGMFIFRKISMLADNIDLTISPIFKIASLLSRINNVYFAISTENLSSKKFELAISTSFRNRANEEEEPKKPAKKKPTKKKSNAARTTAARSKPTN